MFLDVSGYFKIMTKMQAVGRFGFQRDLLFSQDAYGTLVIHAVRR